MLLLEKLKPSCSPEQCEQLHSMYLELKVRAARCALAPGGFRRRGEQRGRELARALASTATSVAVEESAGTFKSAWRECEGGMGIGDGG